MKLRDTDLDELAAMTRITRELATLPAERRAEIIAALDHLDAAADAELKAAQAILRRVLALPGEVRRRVVDYFAQRYPRE